MKADFYAHLPAGTLIRVADGRLATVVYHNLDGYGIRWGNIREEFLAALNRYMWEGKQSVNIDDFLPEAMLRDPYASANLPCVGEDYELAEVAA